MNNHRYILEPYKGMNTRHQCPSCGKAKTFSVYIDTETGEHIHPTVGRCNRESNCSYHYSPKEYFQDRNITLDTQPTKTYKPLKVIPKPTPVSYIPIEIFKSSLKEYETNHFVQFLIKLFGHSTVKQLVTRYFIGTSSHWQGATVFWQIDSQGKIRTGKIMLYNPITGKRIKEPFSHINWVHTSLKKHDFELQQCLFGEHLLRNNTKPVAIVESEKTAIIASVYFPQFIWLASGSLTNLNESKCQVLKGRRVTLFPDINAYEKWSIKARELSHIATFIVSDLLERKATEEERKLGFDLADYLIRFDHREYPKTSLINSFNAITDKDGQAEHSLSHSQPLKQDNKSWEKEIIVLEEYFAGIDLPAKPIELNQYSTIIDCSKFIESHLTALRVYKGKRISLPFYDRLIELKNCLNAI